MARFSINKSHDWHVKHDDQDIRGWPAYDATGEAIGHVSDLVADTESGLVETIVLDNGSEYPAGDIELRNESVYVEGFSEERAEAEPVVKAYHKAEIREREQGSATGFARYEPAYREHYETTYTEEEREYSHFHPAYRVGYDFGMLDDYRDKTWNEAEPDVRRHYEETYGEGTWNEVKGAARHAFEHARKESAP